MTTIISWTALFLLIFAFWNLAALAAPKIVEWLNSLLHE